VYAGQQVLTSISLVNSQPLREILIPFEANVYPLHLTFDSITRGVRTDYFERLSYPHWEPDSVRFTVRLGADDGGGALPLEPGSGEIMRIYCTTDPWGAGGLVDIVDTTLSTPQLMELMSLHASYVPVIHPGEIRSKNVMCGDVNFSNHVTLSDITDVIDAVYISQIPLTTRWPADMNGDRKLTLSDITILIDHVYISKAPITCAP
jgi:hypothetical protein